MSNDHQRLKQFLYSSLTSSSDLNLEIFEVSRVFQLQSGETLSIRNVGCEDYLCIVNGAITIIDYKGDMHKLDVHQSLAHRVFFMPKNSHLMLVTAETDSIFYHVDSEKLDDLVFWKELIRTIEVAGGQLLIRQMDKLRHLSALRCLPAESIYEAVNRMKIIDVKAGEKIIRQGETGDAFYVIDSGRAEVWQTGFYDDEPKKITELGEGECFGEDAIMTGDTRSATINIIEDSQLLVLNQSDFLELISKPMIREIEASIAKTMMENGSQMLDVRCEEEHAVSHIPGALSIPLHQLRQRLNELNHNLRYVTYCHTGKRGAVAALILNQREFDAVSLKGGLLNWPFELKCWHLTGTKESTSHLHLRISRSLKFLSILNRMYKN
jgi:CRP-like cAMP-binding protein